MIDDVRIVSANISGRYALPDQTGRAKAYACRASSISTQSVLVSAPVVGEIGQRTSFFFSQLGILPARITRRTSHGFGADFILPDDERTALRTRLKWLKARATDHVEDRRGHPRVPPKQSRSTLTLADGEQIDAFIIDVSQTGAAVAAEYKPYLGQPVALGRVVCRVARISDIGFGLEFTVPHALADLERLLLPLPRELNRPAIDQLHQFRVQAYDRVDGVLVLSEPVSTTASSPVEAAAKIFGETLVPFGPESRLRARVWRLGSNLTAVMTSLYTPEVA